jgi:hypothetical protein
VRPSHVVLRALDDLSVVLSDPLGPLGGTTKGCDYMRKNRRFSVSAVARKMMSLVW